MAFDLDLPPTAATTIASSREASNAMRETIKDMWDKFAHSVLPKDCSDLQRNEMRRAFYCGVVSGITSDRRCEGDLMHEAESFIRSLQELN